jgi:outer membrane protein assembly factor BamA
LPIPNKKITNIEFSGNHRLKHPELFINIPIDTIISDSMIDSWKSILVTKYSELGYFWTDISDTIIKQNENTLVRYKIKENEQAKISAFDMLSNDTIFKPIYKIKHGQNFSKKFLDTQVQTILDYYNNNGYPFVTITPVNFQINDSLKSISYNLKIEQSPLVKINNIQFAGISSNQYRLRQLLDIKPNAIFSAIILKRHLSRLSANGILIDGYRIFNQDTLYSLIISGWDKKNQEISAAISYIPDNKEINGFFSLNLNNLFNTLRKIKIGWSSYSHYTNFLLNYSDPYLLGFSFDGNINNIIYDTIYSKTDFNLEVKLPILDYTSLYFYSGYERTTSGIASIPNFQTIWIGQGVTIDRENIYDITGLKYNIDISTIFGSRNLSNYNQLLAKTFIESRFNFPIHNNYKYLLDLSAKNLYSNRNLMQSDSLYIGGVNTLRGFQENEFSTNRFILMKNEFTFFTSQKSNLYLFTDFAVFNNTSNGQFKAGYGVGLRTTSKVGLVELDYGLPYKENLLKGKIHLRFTSQF